MLVGSSHKTREIASGQKCQGERENQHHEDVAQQHEHGCEEGDVGFALYHREEGGNDDHGDYIGNDGEGGERAYAATQLLGYHHHRGCCGTDEADEHAFEHEFYIGVVAKDADHQYHEGGDAGTDKLDDEVPCAWSHL